MPLIIPSSFDQNNVIYGRPLLERIQLFQNTTVLDQNARILFNALFQMLQILKPGSFLHIESHTVLDITDKTLKTLATFVVVNTRHNVTLLIQLEAAVKHFVTVIRLNIALECDLMVFLARARILKECHRNTTEQIELVFNVRLEVVVKVLILHLAQHRSGYIKF